jgi:hypothetical protein
VSRTTPFADPGHGRDVRRFAKDLVPQSIRGFSLTLGTQGKRFGNAALYPQDAVRKTLCVLLEQGQG